MFPKQAIIRSKVVTQSANGERCVRCLCQDDTVVLAHYQGQRQHQYGKGKGIKGHDILAAYLCRVCHEYFDQPELRKNVLASEEFLHCIALTIVRMVEKEVLTVKGMKP